jgi:hypothetical protein
MVNILVNHAMLESMQYADETIDYLSQFPKVRDWWLANQHRPPTREHPAAFHLAILAKSLKLAKSNMGCQYWAKEIKQLASEIDGFLEHILECDQLANSLDTALTDIYGKLAEAALLSGEGMTALSALQVLAVKTNLAAFRFLAAFTAFNMNDYETTINECESVTEPFGPINTLLGQALLESGNPIEAIDALKVACAVSPSDPLPLVQIVKAYLVTGVQSEAMKAVDKCRKLLGHHIEIECLAAMTIMAGPHRNAEFNSRTFRALDKHMTEYPDDFEAYAIAMDLSSELQDRNFARQFTRQLEINETINPQRLALRVSEILKKSAALNWHDVSKELIDKTILTTRNLGFSN